MNGTTSLVFFLYWRRRLKRSAVDVSHGLDLDFSSFTHIMTVVCAFHKKKIVLSEDTLC